MKFILMVLFLSQGAAAVNFGTQDGSPNVDDRREIQLFPVPTLIVPGVQLIGPSWDKTAWLPLICKTRSPATCDPERVGQIGALGALADSLGSGNFPAETRSPAELLRHAICVPADAAPGKLRCSDLDAAVLDRSRRRILTRLAFFNAALIAAREELDYGEDVFNREKTEFRGWAGPLEKGKFRRFAASVGTKLNLAAARNALSESFLDELKTCESFNGMFIVPVLRCDVTERAVYRVDYGPAAGRATVVVPGGGAPASETLDAANGGSIF